MKLYVIIDEYDNFTNTILAESGLNAYNELCHGDGFFKDFFAKLKAATTGTEAPVARLFITGVSPVTMDDVTSGFNINKELVAFARRGEWRGFTGSGATFNIDGMKVAFSAEDIATLEVTGKKYTLAKVANGGTITGNLLQPDTDAALPTGWHVIQTPGSVTLRKNGVTIHIR